MMAGEDSTRQGLDLSRLAHKLRVQQQNSPERQAYLKQLAEKIRRGEYQVDAAEVARKIVDDALES
jgi:anti-sigma28 factor (negative regulator of flagellin synthesis)